MAQYFRLWKSNEQDIKFNEDFKGFFEFLTAIYGKSKKEEIKKKSILWPSSDSRGKYFFAFSSMPLATGYSLFAGLKRRAESALCIYHEFL